MFAQLNLKNSNLLIAVMALIHNSFNFRSDCSYIQKAQIDKIWIAMNYHVTFR